MKFGTAGTSEYPRELREIRGKAIVDEVMSRGLLHFKFSFVEVFSGPKAPLTEAVKNYILSLAARPGLSLGLPPAAPLLSPPGGRLWSLGLRACSQSGIHFSGRVK